MPVDKAKKQQLKEKYQDEQVFVVPFPVVAGYQDGFDRKKHTSDIWQKFDTVGKYIFRYDAEGEPAFQQIIPYILVIHPNMDRFYVSRRLIGSGEQRLVGKSSMGFGGHINPCDGATSVLFHSLFRELHEELDIATVSEAKFIGYVRDLNSATNDHLGCVFIVQASEVSVKETDKYEGEWMTYAQIEEEYFKFEDWSKHIIDYVVKTGERF